MSYIPKIKNARLAADAVTSDKILDGEVMSDDLAADAVTGAQLADDAVGSEHIAAGAVGADEIATGAVGTDELAADAVTGDKLADDAVGSEHIAAGAVGNSELGADAVDGSKIADDAVGSEHISAGAVGNSELADGAVNNAKVAADAAIELSKLATDPLDRANHTGTQLASTISDFDAQVQTNSLDEMAAPEADVDMNGNKLTGLAEPTASDDAATKQYVDNLAMGLDVKASVRVATQGDVDLANPALNGAGDLEIDGIVLAEGDRVLVKEQALPEQNGIYVAVFPGGFKALARAEDADSDAEVTGGMFTFVEQGTNADQGWVLTTDNPIVLDSTPLAFSQFSNAVIVSTLDSLTDVTVGNVNNGSMLFWDGSEWRSTASDVSESQIIVDDNGAILSDNEIAVVDDVTNVQYGAVLQSDTLDFYGPTSSGDIIFREDLGEFQISTSEGSNGLFRLDEGTGLVVEGIVRYSGNQYKNLDFTIDASDGRHLFMVDTANMDGPITATLPASPVNGDLYQIKDTAGNAEVHAITVDGNGNNIDGDASFTMDVNYQSVTLYYDGTKWNIL